jgi:hypothetical protein
VRRRIARRRIFRIEALKTLPLLHDTAYLRHNFLAGSLQVHRYGLD